MFSKNIVKKNKEENIKYNSGMTYIELIVVLSIFSIMSSVILFNYSKFQAKVNIKSLATDIALKISEAQKSALGGKLPTQVPTVSPWKPSYGLNFNLLINNKQFVYFTDLNLDTNFIDPLFCPIPNAVGSECLEKINITKGNFISSMSLTYQITPTCGSTGSPMSVNPTVLSVSYKRPNSGAVFTTDSLVSGCNKADFASIIISSPNSNTTATIKVHASGRIEIL